MKIPLVLFTVILAASITSSSKTIDEPNTTSSHHNVESYAYAPAYYKYEYSVKDDYYNNYGAEESREGDSIKGSYFVDLPDGRRQVVTYYVNGDSGFVADVQYKGEAKLYEVTKAPKYYGNKNNYDVSNEPVYHHQSIHDHHHYYDDVPVYHRKPVDQVRAIYHDVEPVYYLWHR